MLSLCYIVPQDLIAKLGCRISSNRIGVLKKQKVFMLSSYFILDMESLASENKVQICTIDSWKLISLEMKKYCDIVDLGKKYISAVLAHHTTLSNVQKADIKDTELYKMDPDISKKLEYNIKVEISAEETAINKILNNLQSCYIHIMGKVDKILNIYKESNLSAEEMTKANLTSLPTVEMLELIDRFKRSFSDSHDSRKYTLGYYHFTKDAEKILSAWDTTEIISLKEKLDHKLL